MNGLETIVQRLQADGQAEVDAILAAATQEAAAITASYTAQAEKLQAQLDTETKEVVAQRQERLESATQMEGRKVLLSAKQDLVAQTFAQAEAALCALPQEEYIAFFTRCLVTAAPKGTGDVQFGANDANGAEIVKRANETLNGQLTLAAPGTMAGGFILVDGDQEVNATAETLVRLQRSNCASAVAKILFESTN